MAHRMTGKRRAVLSGTLHRLRRNGQERLRVLRRIVSSTPAARARRGLKRPHRRTRHPVRHQNPDVLRASSADFSGGQSR